MVNNGMLRIALVINTLSDAVLKTKAIFAAEAQDVVAKVGRKG